MTKITSNSVASVKGLSADVAELFGLTTPKLTEDVPTVKTQREELFDAITASNPTPQELWQRMAEANYALTPSKKLFTAAWGDSTGALYAQTLSNEVNRFGACLLRYEAIKRTAPKKANSEMRTALFEMLHSLANRCGLSIDGKIKPSMLESIATHSYNYGYADRTDIKKGWSARPTGAWSMLSFILKELSASQTMGTAADTAATRYARGVQRLAKMSEV